MSVLARTGRDEDAAAPARVTLRRREAALVPPRAIAGTALIATVAIMTFLAALAAGAVDVTLSASRGWTGAIAREATVQLRPAPGRDADADLARAAALARAAPGVSGVRTLTRAESESLLEPWLGAGLDLRELPVPRVAVLTLAAERPDLGALREALRAIPGASLDDHRAWTARLSAMAGAMVALGLGIVALVLAATALAVTLATRAAVAGAGGIVEVLNLVGADDRFVAGAFQARFLRLGLQGATLGAGAAVAAFAFAAGASSRAGTGPEADQIEAMFGSFSLSWAGYAAIVVLALFVAGLTAVVSRGTVRRRLAALR